MALGAPGDAGTPEESDGAREPERFSLSFRLFRLACDLLLEAWVHTSAGQSAETSQGLAELHLQQILHFSCVSHNALMCPQVPLAWFFWDIFEVDKKPKYGQHTN